MKLPEKTKAWLSVTKTLTLLIIGYAACETGVVKFNAPQAQPDLREALCIKDILEYASSYHHSQAAAAESTEVFKCEKWHDKQAAVIDRELQALNGSKEAE